MSAFINHLAARWASLGRRKVKPKHRNSGKYITQISQQMKNTSFARPSIPKKADNPSTKHTDGNRSWSRFDFLKILYRLLDCYLKSAIYSHLNYDWCAEPQLRVRALTTQQLDFPENSKPEQHCFSPKVFSIWHQCKCADHEQKKKVKSGNSCLADAPALKKESKRPDLSQKLSFRAAYTDTTFVLTSLISNPPSHDWFSAVSWNFDIVFP
jgi:hypothetical protein